MLDNKVVIYDTIVVMNAERLYDVIRHVRPVHQLSAQVVASALEPTGMTVPMRAVLERLADDGARTVPQIARELWITRQGVQKIVDEAKARGFVVSRKNPQHKRSHLIELTPAGRSAYESLHADELARLDEIAEGLDPADVEAAVRVMSHLTQSLRAMQHSTD